MQAGKSCRFTIMSAALMLIMLSCLGHGWAQTLNYPFGLALDAKGNLYVTNVNSNQVLVYSPNYVQQPGKSITSDLSMPTSVAFDSKGNVYVANYTGNGGTGSITQYSSAGVLNTRFSITDGIFFPIAIAVDGVDDLYVSNGGRTGPNFTVYPLADTINGPFLLTTITDTAACQLDSLLENPCAIAVHAGDLYVGASQSGSPAWEKGFISELLAGGGRFPVFQTTKDPVLALATDSAGDLYVATFGDGEVDFWSPKDGPVVFLKNLSFAPADMVVDSARGASLPVKPVYKSSFCL